MVNKETRMCFHCGRKAKYLATLFFVNTGEIHDKHVCRRHRKGCK